MSDLDVDRISRRVKERLARRGDPRRIILLPIIISFIIVGLFFSGGGWFFSIGHTPWFPWVFIVGALIFSGVLRRTIQAVRGDYVPTDHEIDKAIRKEIRREQRRAMRRSWENTADTISDRISQRIRNRIEGQDFDDNDDDEIGDYAMGYEKPKRGSIDQAEKRKNDTVRLGDDGELIYDDDAPSDQYEKSLRRSTRND